MHRINELRCVHEGVIEDSLMRSKGRDFRGKAFDRLGGAAYNRRPLRCRAGEKPVAGAVCCRLIDIVERGRDAQAAADAGAFGCFACVS